MYIVFVSQFVMSYFFEVDLNFSIKPFSYIIKKVRTKYLNIFGTKRAFKVK